MQAILEIAPPPVLELRQANGQSTTPPIISDRRNRHAGKDASLESTIATQQVKLAALGFHVEERSWLNPIDGIWSVRVRDRDCPLMFTNGKGASKLACLASALGEFFERLSCNYFWNHNYLGRDYAWSVAAIRQLGFDISVADFQHLGVCACRIIVQGMSEIYPVD